MIPIRDEQGRMAGFGARVVDADDVPKFLNSPETPVFTKGRLLYGLDKFPNLARFLDRIHARPAYRRALERGGPYAFGS